MDLTVLIADNDAELCQVCKNFFHNQGFRVETALDGLDCLNKLRSATPKVLILNLDLPWGGDGILTWLHEENGNTQILVITTANRERKERARTSETAAPEFLPKPFSLTALMQSVQAAVAKTRPSFAACSPETIASAG